MMLKHNNIRIMYVVKDTLLKYSSFFINLLRYIYLLVILSYILSYTYIRTFMRVTFHFTN